MNTPAASFRSPLPLGITAAAALLLAGLSLASAQTLTVDQANGNSPYDFNADASYSGVFVGDTSAGVLNHTAGTLTDTGDLVLGNSSNANGAYKMSGTGALSVSGNEYVGDSGSGAFTQTGGTNTVSGVLCLGHNAGSSGSYTLSDSSGQLGLPTQGLLQASAVTRGSGTGIFNFNGGTLQALASTTTFMQNLTAAYVQANGAFIEIDSFNVTIAQPLLSGNPYDNGLILGGRSGTLTLTGSNTYVGGNFIASGTLKMGNASALGAAGGDLTMNAGTLDLNGYNLTIGALSGGVFGGVITSSSAGNLVLTASSEYSSTFGGSIQDGAATSLALTKAGTGTLTLSRSNSYSGGTNVTGGTLAITGKVNAPGSNFIVDGTAASNPTATLSGSGLLSANTAYVGNSGTGKFLQSGGRNTVSQLCLGHNAGSSGSYTLGDGSYQPAPFYNGVLQVSTVTGGSGTGIFNFNGGTLQALASTTTFMQNLTAAKVQGNGAVIDTNGFNVTIAQPLVTGPVYGYGDGGLVKAGPGTLTLTGSNTYNGGTFVDLGTLKMANASALGPDGGTLAFGGPGTLDLNGYNLTIDTLSGYNYAGLITSSSAGNLVLTASSVYSSTFRGSIQNGSATSLALIKAGTGTLTLAGSNGYTGGTTISGGTLQIGDGQVDGSIVGDVVNNAALVFNRLHSLTYGGQISGTGTLTKQGAGTLIITGANIYTGTTTVSAGTLLVNNTTGSGTGSGAITVTNRGTVLGGTGTISASGNAVSIGSGAILLGGDGSTASGALTLNGDLNLSTGSIVELTVGASGAHSTLTRTGGTWSFAPNQAFTFISSQAGFYDNIITGLSGDPGSEATWTTTNAGFTDTFSYDGLGNIDLTVAEVPEPRTLAGGLLALGATLAAATRRWQRRRQHSGGQRHLE